MPRRDTTSIDRTYQFRDALIPHAGGLRLDLDGTVVHVAPVPLLRHAAGGADALEQAVRVAVTADAPVTVRVALTPAGVDAPPEGAAGEIPGGPGAGTHLLFIPEPGQPATYRVEAAIGDRSAVGTLTVEPPRKMTISVVQHSHLDIGYTDPQAIVLAAHQGFLDQALALVRQTADWPEPARFRWVVEVTHPLRQWLATRPRAMREAFLAAVRSGQIEINALSMNMHTEAYSYDELARQLAFADELRHDHGVEIVSGTQSDVPGSAVGLVSLLTDAGVKYLCVAHNYAGRSVPHLVGGQALARPFWWAAPDGERVLVWMTDSAHGNYVEGNLLGFDADYGVVLANLPEYLASLLRNPYPLGPFPGAGPSGRTTSGYDNLDWTGTRRPFEVTRDPYPHDILHIRVQGEHSDNAHPSLAPATIVREWNERWAWPRLRTSTNRDFFERAEATLGEGAPTFAGDWGDWWADGLGSAARAIGVGRRAQGDVRTGQTLHTVANATAPADDRLDALPAIDAIYDDLAIWDEHTWGASNPWNDRIDTLDAGQLQWGYKEAYAHRSAEGAAALVASALPRLSHLAADAAATGLAVFNPSGWQRTDLVRVLVPSTTIPGAGGLTVLDAETGEPVPSVTAPEPYPRARAEGTWLTLLARDVPPLGYRRYRLVAGAPEGGTATAGDLPPFALETDHLSLSIDPARAFIDTITAAGGRALVNPDAPFGMNEVIHERYTTAPGFNHHSNFTVADGNRMLGGRRTATGAVVVRRERDALADRVTYRATGPGLDWLETTVALPHHAARVDITNRIHKPATPEKESLYVAFPFAAPGARVRFAVTGGTAGPDEPTVPGSAHYFRAIRHHATLESPGRAPIAWATAEAPLVQQGTIHIPYAPFPSALPPERTDPATLYSWALNNLWDTNFPDRQGGEMTFRYAIATGDGPATELGRDTAASVSAPMVGILAVDGAWQGDALPPAGSFARLDHPEVAISHLAPSRRGAGLVAFIASTAAEAADVTFASDLLPVRGARLASFLERDGQPLQVDGGQVRFTVPAGALVALQLDLAH